MPGRDMGVRSKTTSDYSNPLRRHDAIGEARWRRVSSTHDVRALELQGEACDSDRQLGHARLGLLLIFMSLTVLVYAVAACAHFMTATTCETAAYLVTMQRVAAVVPATIIFVFINWFSIKLFKHNS